MEYIAIRGIGTAVPSYRLEQEDASRRLKEALRDRPTDARWVQRIFASCGVESRYTCEPELLKPADSCRYIPTSAEVRIPTTAERMGLYREASVPLAEEAARKALADSGIHPGDITHLIAASCTGMFLPGLDTELSGRLDLRADVNRTPLTFLGCAAGLTALRLALETVRANREAQVLVVMTELCSLHIQPSFDREELFTSALFGDGASACVVAAPVPGQRGILAIHEAQAATIPRSAELMQWTIGNYGFRLRLSPEIPALIAEQVPVAVRTFGAGEEIPELWAIHPGGRGIIDAVASAFRLTDGQVEASRSVLREYGNMSSATILFVLDRLRERQRQANEQAKQGIALAFGPGMVAEMLRFSYQPC